MRSLCRRISTFVGLLSPAILLVGCGGLPPNDVEIQEAPLTLTVPPTGTTCGLGYYKDGRTVVDGICQGVKTLQPQRWTCSSLGAICISPGTAGQSYNTHNASDGDRGLASGWGFYHQAMSASPGSGDPNFADSFAFPSGTACGFKETCNDSGETCMGFDAKVACPPGPGWKKKMASDLKGPNGCTFVWCEYQDPNGLCTGSCALNSANVPSGTVCGITDNDLNNGQCLGRNTTTGCPAGWGSSNAYYDEGRSSGHGVGWCFKP